MKPRFPRFWVGFLVVSPLWWSTGCGSLMKRQSERRAPWVRTAPGEFRYGDQRLEIELTVTDQRQLRWRLKNLAFTPVDIDFRELALMREGDTTAYTLWGEPKQRQPELPKIRIQPANFMVLTYPVRARGPFTPFRTEPEVRLSFIARWGERAVRYELVFPKPSPTDG